MQQGDEGRCSLHTCESCSVARGSPIAHASSVTRASSLLHIQVLSHMRSFCTCESSCKSCRTCESRCMCSPVAHASPVARAIDVPIPKKRADALAALKAARALQSDMPQAARTHDATPTSAPAPAPTNQPLLWMRGWWGGAREQCGGTLTRVHPGSSGTTQQTIVQYRMGARVKYRFVLHIDDGADDLVQLPDEPVKLLDSTVERCTCERCVSYDDAGARCLCLDGHACAMPSLSVTCDVVNMRGRCAGYEVGMRGAATGGRTCRDHSQPLWRWPQQLARRAPFGTATWQYLPQLGRTK